MTLIEWIGNFIPLVGTGAILIAFLVGVLGGAETFFLLAFLSAQGLFDLKTALIFCFLGNVLAESVFFFIGKIEHLSSLKKWEVTSEGYKNMGKLLHKIGRGHPFVLLTISKLVYGTGIVTILYVSIEKLKFKKFILYSVIINLLWIPFIMTLGWFSGKGFNLITSSIDSIKIMILFLIALLLGLYLVQEWIIKKILKN